MLVSIHAPHAGRDHQRTAMNRQVSVSIHAPHAGRDPSACVIVVSLIVFQSTRPMRGATSAKVQSVSIFLGFNPRAPCGARLWRLSVGDYYSRFQSTRPMRGATACRRSHCPLLRSFNPRAPCGARLYSAARFCVSTMFQSTRPMRGATCVSIISNILGLVFQSTRPMRGATRIFCSRTILLSVSIHAPHAGRDGYHSDHGGE